jgi:hypothetical protein
MSKKVKQNSVDHWGGIPLDDAKNHKHKQIVELLDKQCAK